MVTKPLSGIANITRNIAGSFPTNNGQPNIGSQPLYDDNGGLTDFGKQVDAGKVNDPVGRLILGLDAYNNATDEDDSKNRLPRTFLGNTASGVITIAPDLLTSTLLPEAELGEGASTLNKLKAAVFNPFNKVAATRSFLGDYGTAKSKGKTSGEATVAGVESAADIGAMGFLGGVTGDILSPKIYKTLTESGLVKGGKITQMGIDAASDAAVFGMYPVAKDIAMGKPVDTDAMQSGFGMGLLFGGFKALKTHKEWTDVENQLKNVWADRYAMATQNFMNAAPDAISDVHNMNTTDSDLFAQAADFAAKAKDEPDLQQKKAYIAQASTLAKMSDVKGTIDAILHDPIGFVKNVRDSELPYNQKVGLMGKALEIYRRYGSKPGEEPELLGQMQHEAAMPPQEPQTEPNGPSSAEEQPKTTEEPRMPSTAAKKPFIDTSLQDDLDAELDAFKRDNEQKPSKPSENVSKLSKVSKNDQNIPETVSPVKFTQADLAKDAAGNLNVAEKGNALHKEGTPVSSSDYVAANLNDGDAVKFKVDGQTKTGTWNANRGNIIDGNGNPWGVTAILNGKDNYIEKEEPNDADAIESAKPIHVEPTPGNSQEVGSRDAGHEQPAGTQAVASTEVQGDEEKPLTGEKLESRIESKQTQIENLEKMKAAAKKQEHIENIDNQISESKSDLNELKRQRPYYVKLPDSYEEVKGKPVPNEHGLDLFSHPLVGNDGYGVTEGSTGLFLAKGDTEEQAVAKAHELIDKNSPEKVKQLISNSYEQGNQSPRGIVDPESPDTKNTEAVVTKAATTVRKAKATKRGAPESAGVIGEIDNALDALDEELINQGFKGGKKAEDNIRKQKAIDSVVHGVLYSPDEVFDGSSPRFDFGMNKAEKDRAYRDIQAGKYDTTAAKKMLDKIQEWDDNDAYPVVRGTGGTTTRTEAISSDDIQRQIDENKANQLGELSQRQVEEFNKHAEDLGITAQDIKDYEEYEKSNNRTAAGIQEPVQESRNDGGANDQQTEGDTSSQGEQSKQQSGREKYEDELKKAKKAFFDTFGAFSGINPETIEKGIRLLSVYAKIGIHDFKAIAGELADELGDKFKNVFEGLKAAYGAFATQEATDEQLDQMTDLREVRKAKVEDFLKPKNESRSEHAAVDQNPPAVAAGEPAGRTAEPEQQKPAKKLRGSKNDTGSQAGGEVKGQRNEPESDRERSGGNDTGTGTGRAAGGSAEPDQRPAVQPDAPERVVKPEDRNHVIKPDDTLVPTGDVGKFNANVDAIFLLKKLEAEDRNPTPAEKQELAKYVGWGGLAKYLETKDYSKNSAVESVLMGKRANVYNQQWRQVYLDYTGDGPMDITKYSSFNDLLNDVRQKLANAGFSASPDDLRAPLLKHLLSNEEYSAALNSTINAHYTERRIISNMWNVAQKLGFKGGKVLETSAGIGHFFGLLPEALRNKTALTGYELDNVTGRLLKKLYPQANITIGGFESSRVPQNSQDIVIGNVPFAQNAPYDKAFPELSKFSMHNYFIGKSLKLLKPGGIAALITSSSTMDSPASAKFREWVTSPDGGNSYLVGAIRFPNNAFSENAGTEVTTDLLVFQKRGQVVDNSLEQPFRYTRLLKTGKNREREDVDIHVNEYYHNHPEQMLGDMMTAHEAGSGGLYNSGQPTLKAPEGFDLDKSLAKANEIFPKDIAGNKTVPNQVKSEPITATDKKEGSLFEKEGKLYKVADGDGEPVTVDAKQQKMAKSYLGLKNNLLELIQQEQSTSASNAEIEANRAALNKAYDQFVKDHGNINARGADFLNDMDIDYPIVASLENIARKIETVNGRDKIVSTISKGDILNKRVNFPRTEPTKAADIKDAINISLNYRTGLDVNYMASMLGEDPEALRNRLLKEELAFDNPDTGILETPEEYLSGFVRDKLRKAESAAVNDPAYRRNVAELKKVIPEDIPSSLIQYSLGSSWIPSHVYEGFVKQLLEANVGIKYLDKAGKFIMNKGYGQNNALVMNTYGAGGKSALDILEDTLNNKQIEITDTVVNPDGSKRQVKNPEKTAAAQAMQQQLQDEFVNYINGNEGVQRETEKIYNDVFNGNVLRQFRVPDFKHYPGASTTIALREHQKRAVSRNLAESTLDAHQVGSGKTYTLITTAMEMRRLGTARKPLIGVQNSTLGDFVSDFKKLYPSAKILAPTSKEMEANGRKKLFARIATGDWDAIVLPHSQIDLIPDDPERQKAYIMEQIQEMRETMDSLSDARERRKMESEIKKLQKEIDGIYGVDDDEPTGKKSSAKSIAKKSLSIEAKMQKALDRKTDQTLYFEQLGIDAFLYDEAQRAKRLGFQTAMTNIKGIDTSRSQRSQSTLLKTRWVQEKTGGKNVIFATGTPISNTMAEAWTFLRYLRPDILEHMGIQYFDQFAKTFGQVVPSLEQTGGGTFKVQNRFAKFQNLPEFINAFRTMADIVLTEDVKEFQNTDTIPKLHNNEFTKVILPQSPELQKQIKDFRDTLEWFDSLSGNAKRENSHIPLVIYNKAKQSSIDLRLLDPSNVDSPQSKANEAVEQIYKRYKASSATKGTQMVFSDMYQSPEPKHEFLDEDGTIVNPAYGKPRFHLFEDIKKKLVAKGIPADQIIILTEPKYDKPERKKAVFADMREGKVRVALGTTEKMGVGVNAQTKMVALHHLDAPARPMDFEQRNGRIIRQGNENKEVDVATYGVEKTLDSSAFQRLSTKQKFINQVMKGENVERVTEDPADDAGLPFDEMMAQLSDSPHALKKLLVDNKLRSEQMKQQNFNQKLIKTNKTLRSTEQDLKRNQSKLNDDLRHADIVREKMPEGNITSLKIHNQPEATEKFAEAANGYIERLVDKFHESPTHYSKGGFEVNGIRVELEVENNPEISKVTGILVNKPLLRYSVPDLGLNGEWGKTYEVASGTGQGLLTSLRSKIDSVRVRPAHTQREIDSNEKDIEQLKKDVAAKFDDTKLKELQAESDELKDKMLADNKKPAEQPAQTPGEYIKDQSNIKPALDFLDKMKANPNGKLMSSIVPIPPAVWNGAIDVMKNILRATNSTQKAIRVAAKYIVDRGGTEAQAKDFEATMSKQIENTQRGKISTASDSDESGTEESLIKAATDLKGKIDTTNLSPDERAMVALKPSDMTKKELHRYIEITSVMAVDPQGVITRDVKDLISRVENRQNPRGGTSVPPTVPPGTPPVTTGGEDDEPSRKRIPKKEKLPMESTLDLPEQTDNAGKPVAKENYSAWGKFKDIRVRNLEQLKQYGEDLGNMAPLRDVRQYATSKSQSSVIMKTATQKIVSLVGKDGWGLLRQALVESRLRGIKERWNNWSDQIRNASDNELDDMFEHGQQSAMYDILSRLDGYEDDPKPEQTILGMISNGQYDDAREYMSDMFDNAGNNVAFYDKLGNGKTFDQMVQDGKFTDPKYQEALESYKSLLAKPFEQSHAGNEGVFSDALGPLDTYYPLVPTGADSHFIVGAGNKFRAPQNQNNKFATGQGEQYSSALADLSNRLSSAIRTNNKAQAIKTLETSGLVAKVTKDDPDTGYITVNGELYTATKVQVSDQTMIMADGKATMLPQRYVMMPTWLYRELKPILFEDKGASLADDFSLFGRINNLGVKLMLGGPIEATSHTYRLLGGVVNSMPYMQEWAYKNGVLGHAGGLVLNNPFVKTFAGMCKIIFNDISSDEALETIQEMSKLGIIPEKTWTKTWSKEFADLTGAKKVPIWDFSPILYGKNSIDLKSRVLLYRLSKAMNPNATPEQIVRMQNELGNYTTSLQGDIEKFVKKHGLAPFYSFGGAIYRSGMRAVFGLSHLPLDRPSLKEAFTTKMGAEQMGKFATYKMAQLLTAGMVGLVAAWALTYHGQRNKWPWEDKESKFLKVPLPEGVKNDFTKKLFFDKKSGTWNDIDFSFFNPYINRGTRALGLPKAYETAELGGTPGQALEAGTIQAINTNLSPYTSSPSIQLGVTALTGDAPYITGIRDKFTGTPGIGFYRKVNTFPAGAQIPANLAVGVSSLNPIADYAFSPVTKSLRYNYSQEDQDAYTATVSVLNTILPHLWSPHGNDEAKEKAIKKQEKAINTSMNKEQHKTTKQSEYSTERKW